MEKARKEVREKKEDKNKENAPPKILEDMVLAADMKVKDFL